MAAELLETKLKASLPAAMEAARPLIVRRNMPLTSGKVVELSAATVVRVDKLRRLEGRLRGHVVAPVRGWITLTAKNPRFLATYQSDESPVAEDGYDAHLTPAARCCWPVARSVRESPGFRGFLCSKCLLGRQIVYERRLPMQF